MEVTNTSDAMKGFDQFRYTGMGVTDNSEYPPLGETDVLDAHDALPGASPGYDRHIVK